ncbi:MAG: response regulator [Bacteroidota bacterium]
MFKKIIIVEDFDSIGLGISAVIQNRIGANEIVTSQYCDDAYLKIKRAIQDSIPFDLLITDLSFEKDHREAKIKGGKELVEKLRQQGISIPIVVYSIEDRRVVIKELLEIQKVGAYVLKGRNGLKNLEQAILTLTNGEVFLSPELENSSEKKELFELEDFDISLLSNLAKGFSQNEISKDFKLKGMSPSSLSSIEKRINRLKEEFEAKNAIQLVATAKDLGLI